MPDYLTVKARLFNSVPPENVSFCPEWFILRERAGAPFCPEWFIFGASSAIYWKFNTTIRPLFIVSKISIYRAFTVSSVLQIFRIVKWQNDRKCRILAVSALLTFRHCFARVAVACRSLQFATFKCQCLQMSAFGKMVHSGGAYSCMYFWTLTILNILRDSRPIGAATLAILSIFAGTAFLWRLIC